MRSFMFVLSVAAVIALAAWAYHENHATRLALDDRARLDREIAALSEAISVQRAEWAFLNRPDRLHELVLLNFDRLKLMPMQGSQFGSIDEVAYPPYRPDLSQFFGEGIDVIGELELLSGEHALAETDPEAEP